MDDRQLRTVWQNRRPADTASPVGEPLAVLMKHTLAKRVRQLSEIALIWDELVPDDIREHTALESLLRGVLTVMVDSAGHRFQLEMLLKSRLQRELTSRFSGSLTRVKIIPGQFASVDLEGHRRYAF